MIFDTKTVWLAVLTAVAVISGIPPAMADDKRCYSSWSEAAPVVHREGLTTIGTLNRLAHRRIGGVIINSMLCRDDDRYFYKLIVRAPHGPLKLMVVDARRPFGREGARK